MKRFLLIIGLFCLAAIFSSCGKAEPAAELPSPEPSESAASAEPAPSSEAVPEEETLTPLYADQIKDGTYFIDVDSSSSMFRIVKCELIVAEGGMNAVLTLSGEGYTMLYMGKGEAALADSETSYIPFVLDSEGAYTFTVPVEALDKEIDCAAWSKRKEKWYDRVLVFFSDGVPEGAITR